MSRWIAILLLVVSVLPSTAQAATQEPFKHAVIIGVSIYRDEEIPPLFGVPNDLDNAKEIAVAMGIPAGNVTELFNEQAPKNCIIAELGKLAAQASEGGRILVYLSGHGLQSALERAYAQAARPERRRCRCTARERGAHYLGTI